MKKTFQKTAGLPYFLRGVAVGALLIFGLEVGSSWVREESGFVSGFLFMEAVDGETPAQEAARIVEKALSISNETMNRPIEKDDIPGIVTGALQSLDPYSGYLGKEMTDRIIHEPDVVSEKLMIGILGKALEEGYVVRSTIPLSPAEGTGLRGGDRLVRIGDEDISDLGGEDALERLRKATQESGGNLIRLVFDRNGEEVRIAVSPKPLPETFAYDMGMVDGNLHIHIQGFFNGISEDVEHIIERNFSSGDVKGIVFDLRGNTGGLTEETRKIAGLVMPKGTLLYKEEGRHIGSREVYTSDEPKYGGLPMAVLIDEGSASASEIFASAMQANDFGVVLGRVSYGKGTIQNVYPFLDGRGAIKITIGEYKDPEGRTIEKIGVMPDVVIEEPAERLQDKDPVFDAALIELEKLRG